MSSATPVVEKRGTKKKKIVISAAVIVVLVMGLLFAVPYFYSSSQTHPAATCTMPNGTPGTFDAATGSCINFTVVITHQEQSFVNVKLLQAGFTASCWIFCHGITYTLDPTVITNDGHDFEQCAIFKVAGTITCAATDTLDVIGLSESATVPAATDHYASAGPCDSANLIKTGGLTDIAGAPTAGTEGTTVTTTVAHTFTAAETDNSVQAACLMTETDTGSHIYTYAEGTFGPDSLVSGNTLTITWSIART
jgi:hypothetical protein